MTRITRRRALGTLLTGAAGGAVASTPVAEREAVCLSASGTSWASMKWAVGVEGQRKADLGDGTFLNPILSGDRPDPSILRDGADYYLTFSSFDAYPGLVIWHSRDLINWQPLNAALKTPVGSVWAPELTKYRDTYYIYIHARRPDYRSIYVVTAEDIRGPWSEPVDLKLHDHIDPGHVVGENGNRYLFLSGGDRVRLAEDGLSVAGPVEHVYDPWRYPDDWVVESFSPEGPKLIRHGGWFYMITAVGGTAGPPTGHMVIVARSRSVNGPWESAPNNPVVRTTCATQKWWSRGHATPVEGPDGSWWLIYHGYENGYWTLGRQTLLDPVQWTKDGWLVARGGDLSRPIPKPARGSAVSHGLALSDDFSTNKLGAQWAFYDPAPDEHERLRYDNGVLTLRAKGSQPRDSSPLCFLAGDPAYQVEVEVELAGGTGAGGMHAGLLLFYNRRLYCGLGIAEDRLVMHRYGLERDGRKLPGMGRRVFLRVTNDRNVVTIHHSPDGSSWSKFAVQMEVSGYHHNVAGDFLSLRPAIYAAGRGEAKFRNVRYQAT